MNRLATWAVLVLALACAVGVTAAHADILLFDYVGFDYEGPGGNPNVFGDIGENYFGVGEVPVVSPPLNSNQAQYQYTYYFDQLQVIARNSVGPIDIIDYTDGRLTIYEDSRTLGTEVNNLSYGVNPPNANVPLKFTDGATYLTGQLKNFRYIYDTSTNTGSFEADFTADGGDHLNDIPAGQRVGWTFSGVSGNSITIPPGYAHQVDGQTFIPSATSAHPGTWGSLKKRYR